ncbi:TetR family transcriptional regulator [Paenibacillus marchantiophytorum]|uniref:TetR family transcriptional regulator n=1 Tax=Paenibacillus marchantiophytorum TaxID=1619310 RepID=A0ABQ1EWH8_9BACL|nr:TetR/AcrR family transcriptional regulator [Paenibacillus marchantiophytorum]GFZ90570.1 TetR family transcriptional regulator [Paenibacillus marchantiophytorum]
MARTKEFDEDTVLYRAMRLFWEQGYEKTSMNDLVASMGIHRRSLYDTFGDKHKLYLQAADRYSKLVNSRLEAGVLRATPKEAISFMFDLMIDGIAEDSPPGCLYVNMAIELASQDSEVEAKVNESFIQSERLLTDIIRRGQEAGEFTTGRSAEELAESLHNALLGLRVLARASTNKEKLHRIANVSKATLDK